MILKTTVISNVELEERVGYESPYYVVSLKRGDKVIHDRRFFNLEEAEEYYKLLSNN